MPRLGRKIVAVKGLAGSRPVLERSKSTQKKFRGAVFYRVGVDQVKTDIIVSLPLERIDSRTGEPNPQSFRFSNTLEEEFYRQLTSEKRVVTYVRGRPTIEFKRIENRRAEALDGTVYAIAVRQLCRFEFDARRVALKGQPAPKKPSFKEIASRLNQ